MVRSREVSTSNHMALSTREGELVTNKEINEKLEWYIPYFRSLIGYHIPQRKSTMGLHWITKQQNWRKSISYGYLHGHFNVNWFIILSWRTSVLYLKYSSAHTKLQYTTYWYHTFRVVSIIVYDFFEKFYLYFLSKWRFLSVILSSHHKLMQWSDGKWNYRNKRSLYMKCFFACHINNNS